MSEILPLRAVEVETDARNVDLEHALKLSHGNFYRLRQRGVFEIEGPRGGTRVLRVLDRETLAAHLGVPADAELQAQIERALRVGDPDSAPAGRRAAGAALDARNEAHGTSGAVVQRARSAPKSREDRGDVSAGDQATRLRLRVLDVLDHHDVEVRPTLQKMLWNVLEAADRLEAGADAKRVAAAEEAD